MTNDTPLLPPLLPCPFCGGTNLHDHEGSTRIRNYYTVSCEDCCADAPRTEWNRRAPVLSPEEREALVVALRHLPSPLDIVDPDDARAANQRITTIRALLARTEAKP